MTEATAALTEEAPATNNTDIPGKQPMSRYQAAFYHFLISLVIFAGLAYLILFQWYPAFFYAIDGGWEGMRLIIGVDLILGPMLTLVVFKAGKPGLKFDLTMIGILQAACLTVGTYIVYSERPLFFVFYEDYLYSSSADTFERYGVEVPDPSAFPGKVPARVMPLLPEDPIELADYRISMYQQGVPPWVDVDTYRPLDDYMDEVIEAGVTEEFIRERDTQNNLNDWLVKHNGSFEDFAFVPIHSRYRRALLGIRKADKTFVDILEVVPPRPE